MSINYIWDVSTGYSTKAGLYKTKIQMGFIDKFLKEKNNLKILDIGGGSGRFAIPLSLNNSVTLIEPNEKAINILRQKTKNINIFQGFFENFINDYEKYDVILMIEVMQYFSDINSLFDKVYNLLNDNGLFIFSNLNKNSWKTFIRLKILKHTNYPGVLSYKKYINIINTKGFEIIDVLGYNWLPVRVCSDSKMVSIWETLEKLLNLNKLYKISPELLFCIKKK